MSLNNHDVYNTLSNELDKRANKRNTIEGIRGELFDVLTLGDDEKSREEVGQKIIDELKIKLDAANSKEPKNEEHIKNLNKLIEDVQARMSTGKSTEIVKGKSYINTNIGKFDEKVLDTVTNNIVELAKNSDQIDDILIKKLIENEKYREELKTKLEDKYNSSTESGLNETQKKNLQSIIDSFASNKQTEETPEQTEETPEQTEETPEQTEETPEQTEETPEANSDRSTEISKETRAKLKQLERENKDLTEQNADLLEQIKKTPSSTEVAKLKKQIDDLKKDKQALMDRYEGTLPKFEDEDGKTVIDKLETQLVTLNWISKKKEGGQTKLRIGPEIAIRHNILSRHRINATIKKLNDLGKELGPDKNHPDAKGVKKGVNYILNKSFLLHGGPISSAYKATRNIFKIRTIPEFDEAFGKQKKLILEDLKTKMLKNTTSTEDDKIIKAVSNRLDYYQAAYKKTFIRV